MDLTPIEGDVWWARPSPADGREQAGRRPVVIVSGAEYHDTMTTLVIAVPVTTRDRGWPNHVALDGTPGLDRPSWAMTEQVRAISRERLVGRVGAVTPTSLAHLRGWVLDYLQ